MGKCWANTSGVAVLLGLSTGREGVDPIQFHAAAQGGLFLLNIAATGGSFYEMRRHSEVLLKSGLKPDLVIMAIHPSWRAGPDLRAAPKSLAVSQGEANKVWTQTGVRQLGQWAAQQVWVMKNRLAINSELRQFLMRWRARIHHWMNVSPIDLIPEFYDPWSVRVTYRDERAPPEVLQNQFRAWEIAGWFDPKRFETRTADAQILNQFVHETSYKTPHVFVALMLESEEFRRRVPL